MPSAETSFERFGLALEATRGTAIANPTHWLPWTGRIRPMHTRYRPPESRGTRAANYRSKVTKQWSEWTIEAGGADTYNLPVLLNMLVAPLASPTTPTNGVLTRDWLFARSMTSDTEKSATLWWGDPNTQIFRAAYAMATSFEISCDATGDDAATIAASGFAQTESKVANPTWPAMLNGPLITPLDMQLWLDTSSAIGTTAISGTFLSATFSTDITRSQKFLPVGPGGSKTFTRTGVGRSSATLALRFELADTTIYDLIRSATPDTPWKVRVALNGPLIETVTGPTSYYHLIRIDFYGTPDEPLDWGEWSDTNRTLDVTLTSEYDVTAATDWSILVRNDRTTL